MVDGDPSLVYGIEEFPAVAVRVGVPAAVPVPHGNYMVHVVERPSGRRTRRGSIRGARSHVAFTAARQGLRPERRPSPAIGRPR